MAARHAGPYLAAVVLVLVAGLVGGNGDAWAQGEVKRVEGSDRFATAVAVSQEIFDDGGADTVVVVTGADYADGLAAGPLAAQLGAPLLLTEPDQLPQIVAAEIERLGATDAIVVGGFAAITAGVEDDLKAAGIQLVDRIAGDDRYHTAALISRRIPNEAAGSIAYIVAGQHPDPARGWPDAVAVGGLAADRGRPILLVRPSELPERTRVELNRRQPNGVSVVGGPDAVTDAVIEAIEAEGHNVGRLAGENRFDTSARVAKGHISQNYNGEDELTGLVWVAQGWDWPDALALAPAVAATPSVLVLVDGTDLDRSPETRDFMTNDDPCHFGYTLAGGVEAISERVEQQIRDIAASTRCPTPS